MNSNKGAPTVGQCNFAMQPFVKIKICDECCYQSQTFLISNLKKFLSVDICKLFFSLMGVTDVEPTMGQRDFITAFNILYQVQYLACF